MKLPWQNLRGLRTGCLPCLLRTKKLSVDLLQWCSCWVAVSKGVLKAHADGGSYLQQNEGKKCCSSAVGTARTRVEQASQTHARGWERKDHSCLPLSQETWIGPQRILRQLQEHCGPPKRPPDINSKGRQHLQDQTWQDEHWHEQDRAIIGIEREQMKEITKRKTLAKLSCSFCLEVSEV